MSHKLDPLNQRQETQDPEQESSQTGSNMQPAFNSPRWLRLEALCRQMAGGTIQLMQGKRAG